MSHKNKLTARFIGIAIMLLLVVFGSIATARYFIQKNNQSLNETTSSELQQPTKPGSLGEVSDNEASDAAAVPQNEDPSSEPLPSDINTLPQTGNSLGIYDVLAAGGLSLAIFIYLRSRRIDMAF